VRVLPFVEPLLTLEFEGFMQDPRLPRLIFGLLVLGAVVYFSRLYAQLPEMLASRFNAAGAPNAWMPKSTFFWFFPAIALARSWSFSLSG
jgi:hypothetical protein